MPLANYIILPIAVAHESGFIYIYLILSLYFYFSEGNKCNISAIIYSLLREYIYVVCVE